MKQAETVNLEELKFPIGQFKRPEAYTPKILKQYISVIEDFPQKLRATVTGLSAEQLDTPYRPQGWSVRQVVHHCADSHINAFIRLKVALTEDTPTIKPYIQELWAELDDGKTMAIEPSLSILEGLHKRWTVVLKGLVEQEWKRGFMHPEKGRRLGLHENTGMYAWHCDHHLAHIIRLKQRMGWN